MSTSFELPRLPYKDTALAPHISAETLQFHHGKHHAAYVTKLNGLLESAPQFQGKTLEDIVKGSEGVMFNQAAQAWNHEFLWNSMHPGGGGEASGALLEKIETDFGGFDQFRSQMHAAAAGFFGSGWAWLSDTKAGLKIQTTRDADTPVRHGDHPIFTIDLWEHAYYIDYRNARPKYLDAFLDHLVNWEFAEQRLGSSPF